MATSLLGHSRPPQKKHTILKGFANPLRRARPGTRMLHCPIYKVNQNVSQNQSETLEEEPGKVEGGKGQCLPDSRAVSAVDVSFRLNGTGWNGDFRWRTTKTLGSTMIQQQSKTNFPTSSLCWHQKKSSRAPALPGKSRRGWRPRLEWKCLSFYGSH